MQKNVPSLTGSWQAHSLYLKGKSHLFGILPTADLGEASSEEAGWDPREKPSSPGSLKVVLKCLKMVVSPGSLLGHLTIPKPHPDSPPLLPEPQGGERQ